MNTPQFQLDYAPGQARKRPKVRRWLIAIGLGMVVWVGFEWGEPLAVGVRQAWVQSRCSTFEYPPETVIFESDPERRAGLLSGHPDEYADTADAAAWPVRAAVRREPACWASLKELLFNTRNFWPPGPAAPKVLVHRLRNSAGDSRLVAVLVAPTIPGRSMGSTGQGSTGGVSTGRELQLVAAIVRESPDFTSPPRWDGNSGFLQAGFENARSLRFYAAQLDGKDPGRFSIRYEMDGQAGTIDGRLESDVSVSLTVRDGPAFVGRVGRQ